MYAKFYNLSEKPFNVTPDLKFLFLTPGHREALASLICGITGRKGFIVLTGEVGTGKTTLLYTLMNNLNPKTKAVFIYHSYTSFEQLLRTILIELEVAVSPDDDKHAMLHRFNDYLYNLLKSDETLAVIIDEAQNLSPQVMEELIMLSNQETCAHKMLQIVLVGQPELEAKLAADSLRQLRQRIGIQRRIVPLSREESRQYIEHRLKIIGSSSSRIFTRGALSSICQHAGGIPRTINIVCDNVLLVGYAQSARKVTEDLVEEVLGDIGILATMREGTGDGAVRPAEAALVQRLLAVFRPVLQRAAMPAGIMACFLVLCLAGMLYLQHRALQGPSKSNSAGLYAAGTEDADGSDRVAAVMAPVNSAPLVHNDMRVGADAAKWMNAKEEQPKLEHEKIVRAQRGSCLYGLARAHYSMVNGTLLDLILQANPEIRNPQLIEVNQAIRLPRITGENLVRQLSDGCYKIHLGTFCAPGAATAYTLSAQRLGKELEVRRCTMINSEYFRVFLGCFMRQDDALTVVRDLRQQGLLPWMSSG
jgi:type II secretory pathway predicted ATPase ExeA